MVPPCMDSFGQLIFERPHVETPIESIRAVRKSTSLNSHDSKSQPVKMVFLNEQLVNLQRKNFADKVESCHEDPANTLSSNRVLVQRDDKIRVFSIEYASNTHALNRQ